MIIERVFIFKQPGKTGSDGQYERDVEKALANERFYAKAPKTAFESRQQQRARLRAQHKRLPGAKRASPPERVIHFDPVKLKSGKGGWMRSAGAGSKPANIRELIRRGGTSPL